MKDLYTALQHCLNAIDLGIDLESCLVLYPEYEGQLRQFFQKWNGSREGLSGLSEKALEQILFDQALDECIKAVGSGESPESCYERYPAYARRMKPWLMAVSDLPRLRREGRLQTEITFDDFFVPEVPFAQALEEYIQAYRENKPNIILARYPYYADRLQFWADKIPEQPQLTIKPQSASPKRPSVQFGWLFSARSLQVPVAVSLAIVVFFFSGLRLASAAAATVPGEPLYSLKLVAEQIHLNIAPENQKEDLKEQFAEERRKETATLIQAAVKQEVAFDGEVTSVENNKVVVSNVVILLDEFKQNKPVISKGEIVHVEGYTSQHGVTVKRLDVRSSNGIEKTFVALPPLSAASAVSSLPSPTPLSVAQSSPTSIFGSIFSAVATPVSSGKGNSSGSGGGVPTSAPTHVPTSTSQPTAVPPTQVPTQVPTIAPTIAPTAVPTAQPTAVPTDPPTPEPTIAPTDVPTPEPTIAPTDPPPPEPTAEPTDAPTLEPTAEPTSNPE